MTRANAAPAGRERELAELLAAFDSARKGALRLTLVRGEPGIGKSTLLDAFAVRVSQAGGLALRGACYDETAHEPYTPFREALRDLRRAVPQGVWPTALVDWLDGVEPQLEQRRLVDAVIGVVIAASEKVALALILDDMHWADEASARMLRQLLRTARSASLMVVAAYRDTDLEQADPFEGVLLELSRERTARRLALRRLERSATRAIVESAVGAPPGSLAPAAVEALQRASEGVPFFAEELALHLHELG